MRCLVRNKRNFFYANYTGKTPVKDEYGNDTGEYTVTYTPPTSYKANISPAKGEVINEYFGESDDYDRVIVLENNIPIDEQTVLWIDTPSTEPYNYTVKSVARNLNSTLIAIKKVEVGK